jgi:hypothetical protein
MTPEWQQYANEITVYIIRRKRKNESELQMLAQTPLLLYNQWANERGCAVPDAELSLWCLDYMQQLVNTPLERLIKAAKIDGLYF